jgi:hypothetical protein
MKPAAPEITMRKFFLQEGMATDEHGSERK